MKKADNSCGKIAVHLHLYYENQLGYILKKLKNLSGLDYDLYVSMAKENLEIATEIRKFCPDACIWVPENRGYDIGPFIDFLHRIDLDAYDYVLKLHTKGKRARYYVYINGRHYNCILWGRILYDALAGSVKQVLKNLRIFQRDRSVGMVGASYCLTSDMQFSEALLPQINANLQELGFAPVQKISFFAGTMFWVRASLLKPLLHYSIDYFPPSDGKESVKKHPSSGGHVIDGTPAHVFERLFAVIVEAQGYKLCGVHPSFYEVKFRLFQCLHFAVEFCYQKKITKSGKEIVKICKIPVYRKKI